MLQEWGHQVSEWNHKMMKMEARDMGWEWGEVGGGGGRVGWIGKIEKLGGNVTAIYISTHISHKCSQHEHNTAKGV